MHAYIHTYIHTYIHIHTHTHTYIHTYIFHPTQDVATTHKVTILIYIYIKVPKEKTAMGFGEIIYSKTESAGYSRRETQCN
jgi:hypothetical protein